MCLGGRYGTICDEMWNNQDASVVCRQLGLSPYGMYSIIIMDNHITVIVRNGRSSLVDFPQQYLY